MTLSKQLLLANLYKKLGFEDVDLERLVVILTEEDDKLASYKEAVCDTVNEYHNEKKELVSIVEDLITVLSTANEYEMNRSAYSEKQIKLLWETASETLIKARKVISTH